MVIKYLGCNNNHGKERETVLRKFQVVC